MFLIRREEALARIEQLENMACEAGNEKEARCYIRAYNAIMSCKAVRTNDGSETARTNRKPATGGE